MYSFPAFRGRKDLRLVARHASKNMTLVTCFVPRCSHIFAAFAPSDSPTCNG